ncbi:MAG TPA: cbb3-type cytochrome c oxidase subunit I, partial [Verrucomicrobiae bacterium]|nr:cbb3-type cytochrome c oxidase subunit I [Verrucomicrobiae bacterium]
MNTTAPAEMLVPAIRREPKNYINEKHTLLSWLFTTDHKRIGLLYLYSLLVYFSIAAIAAAMMRMELVTPQGDMVTSETYNKLFTIHGTLMVWFFLIPSIPTVLGNFVLPMMLGARDVAFPKLNLLSWYLFNLGGLLALYAVTFGGVDTGWTFYTPYSSTYSNSHV